MPVIVVSAYADATSALEATRAGALQVVVKPFDPQRLADAIRNAMSGFFTAARLRAEAAQVTVKLNTLSRREREVLDGFAEGRAIKEIAGVMSVSPKSVETYRARLMQKLGARNAAMLMRRALLALLMEPFIAEVAKDT